MASKKPLVLTNGQIEQIQSGDTVAGASETGQVQQTAAATLIAGNPVYSSGNDTVTKAKADAAGTARVIGLAAAAITGSATGTVQVNGILALTTGEWDALAGTSGGLTAGTTYYLSAATAGLITSTAPSTVGQFVVEIGTAISTTEMNIKVTRPIKL